MLDFKKVLLFIGIFLVIFAVLNLVVPFSGLDKWYDQQFVKVGEKVYGNYKDKAQVEFKLWDNNKSVAFKMPFKNYDKVIRTSILSKAYIERASKLALAQGATSVTLDHAQFFTDNWLYVWLPLLLFWALVLASPVPILRKIIAFLLGTLIINAFIYFKFWVRFKVEFSRHDGWIKLGELEGISKPIFLNLNTFLLYMGSSLIFSIIVWALLTFRQKDQYMFMKQPAAVEE